jgi:hypothetical protein
MALTDRPTRYTVKLIGPDNVHNGFTGYDIKRIALWMAPGTDITDARKAAAANHPTYTIERIEAHPWRWTDGRMLFAHITESEDDAAIQVERYKQDRRNKGAWTVRTWKRSVRAGGVEIPCMAVVVRHKWER